jgi:hypothetical protein
MNRRVLGSIRRAVLSLGVALAGAALLAGCGSDNAGEPRTPAENLMAPTPQSVDGQAHVYCLETGAPVTECDTWFEVSNKPSLATLRDWWLRAASRLRSAGTFTYKDARWRFGDFSLEQRTPDGRFVREYGWRCAGDQKRSFAELQQAFAVRQPLTGEGIRSAALAKTAGCRFGYYLVHA